VLAERPVIEAVNESVPVPLFVRVFEVVGLADVLQQIPLAIIAEPAEILLPPPVAAVVVIPVMSDVVMVGGTA